PYTTLFRSHQHPLPPARKPRRESDREQIEYRKGNLETRNVIDDTDGKRQQKTQEGRLGFRLPIQVSHKGVHRPVPTTPSKFRRAEIFVNHSTGVCTCLQGFEAKKRSGASGAT